MTYAGKPPTCAYSHQPAPIANMLRQVPSPCRLRTAVAPMMPVPPTLPQASIQTTSAMAAARKDQSYSPAPPHQRVPQQQAQSQPSAQSAQTKGAAPTEQLQQFQQAVTAKLEAHQLAQGQANVTVPAASKVGQPSTCSMDTQTHPQDLVNTIQLSPEEFQITFGKPDESVLARPNLQEQEAELQKLQQSWKEAVEELEETRQGFKELEAQLQKSQSEADSLRRDRSRAEQELTTKVAELDKRDQANRKLEGQNRVLQSNEEAGKKQLGEKSEELRRALEELQHVHESSQCAREEVQRLQDKGKELRSELASAEKQANAYTECLQQLRKAQKAQQDLEAGKEAQTRQIEELHNYIFDLRRESDLQQMETKPLAIMQPTLIEQENIELQKKLADAQGDLHNALQQLKQVQSEARNVRAG